MKIGDIKESEKLNRCFITILLLTLIIFSWMIVMAGRDYEEPIKGVEKVSFVGRYRIDDEVKEVENNKLQFDKKYSQVILEGHFSCDIHSYREVFFFMDKMTMTIKKNGEEIYTYGNQNYPNIVKSVGSEWLKLSLGDIRSSDRIEIKLNSVYSACSDRQYNQFLDSIYVGDHYAFTKQQILRNIPLILGSIVLLIVGVWFFSTMQPVKLMGIPVIDGYFSCSLFIVVSAIEVFINFGFISLIVENSFLTSVIDLVARLLIFELLVSYLKVYLVSEKYIRYTEYFVYIIGTIIIAYFIFQLYGEIDPIEIAKLCHPIAIAIWSIMLCWLIKDYKKIEKKALKIAFFPSVLVLICTMISVIHCSLFGEYWEEGFLAAAMTLISTQIGLYSVNKRDSIIVAQKAKKLEEELAQNRIAIMMSQIQPHFLYNALTSIQELCLSEPQLAYEALLRFSKFLRGNMDSLTTTDLIPFKSELQHVQNYIYLEQIRYGEDLIIIYKIEVEDFWVPALSMQPIVENAVRYGIGKKEEGGSIIIRTTQDEKCYQIIIEDNGIGMKLDEKGRAVSTDATKSHIGLENVRHRIRVQCKGELRVESRFGIGTKVTIQIPKEEESI